MNAAVAKCTDLIGQIFLFTRENQKKSNLMGKKLYLSCDSMRSVWAAALRVGKSKNMNVLNISQILRACCVTSFGVFDEDCMLLPV